MTITIELEPKTEEWLADQAVRRGIAPAEYARKLIEDQVPNPTERLTDAEFEQALDEIAVYDPELPVLSRDIDTREFYYQGHD
jgi:hypothetical protein